LNLLSLIEATFALVNESFSGSKSWRVFCGSGYDLFAVSDLERLAFFPITPVLGGGAVERFARSLPGKLFLESALRALAAG
jgi:hypothetical protein